MAYDEELAHRVRECLAEEDGLSERAMFGGLAFMLHGHMAVGVSRQGGLMLHVDPDETDALLERPHARPFEMRGKPTRGWLRVDLDGIEDDADLAAWVAVGADYARSLPPKR